MEPKNIMEEITKNVLTEYLPLLNLPCTCERCINDILALSLNQLKPYYVVKEENAVYVKAKFLEKQDSTNILSVVIKSSLVVAESRRCIKEKSEMV